MAKIVIELESYGNTEEFFNGIIEDYYYSVKNSEDQELADQYASLKYTIKSATDLDPALNCECGYGH
jgi:hypothetical protein